MKNKKLVSKYLQSKRKQFQQGGAFNWADPNTGNKLGAASSLGSSLVNIADPQDNNGVQSDGGAIASGALSGAAAGSAAGPIGMAAGAIIGGTISALNNNKARKAAHDAAIRKKMLDDAKQLQDSQNILANYTNNGVGLRSLESGGILYSWPGGYQVNPLKYTPTKNSFLTPGEFKRGGVLKQNSIYADGGELKPIGKSSSFEVEGHNPNATDDVRVGDAFVDHNEVIKPTHEGLRIFSDTLKPIGSKIPFSKLAKRLEKQKTSDEKRFPNQNKLIETKLDRLFQEQQSLNGNNDGESPDEGLQPVGETPGAGFDNGNMFNKGGLNITGILNNRNRYYDKISPEALGMKPGNYYGHKITQRDPQQIVSEQIYNHEPLKFEEGGRLMPINASRSLIDNSISFKGYPNGRPYHPIDPEYIGMNQNRGLATIAIENKYPSENSENMYKKFNPHTVKGRYQTGGTIQDPNLYPDEQQFRQSWKSLGVLDSLGRGSIINVPNTQTSILKRRGMNPVGGINDSTFIRAGGPIPKPVVKTNVTDIYGNMATATHPQGANVGTFKSGGIHIKPSHRGRFTAYKKAHHVTTEQALHSSNPHVRQMANFARNAKKWHHHQMGGLEENPYDYMGSPGTVAATKEKSKFLGKPNWSNILTTGATLAPVFANMQAATRLPNVPDVYLNKSINLKKINAADQINAAQQGLRVASLAAQQNSANPNAQQAGMGNAQAQFVNQTNSIYGDINRQNTAIGNQEALYNSQIQGINNQALGQRSQNEVARQANILGLQSQNRADLSNKILSLTQQENQKTLGNQKYKMFLAWLEKQGLDPNDANRQLYLKGADGVDYSKNNKRGGIIKYNSGGLMRSNKRLMKKAC